MAKTYNNRHLRTAGRMAVRGIEKTGRWMANRTPGQSEYVRRQSNYMDAIQCIHFNFACMRLDIRRMRRGNDYVSKMLNNGVVVGFTEKACDWIIDHLLFLLDLIWGFISSIFGSVFMALNRALIIIVCNVIFFGFIYLLLTT